MKIRALIRPLLTALLVAAFAGCGSDTSGAGGGGGGSGEQRQGGQATQDQQPAGGDSAQGGQSCDDIPVPGHEAVEVRVQGVGCPQAAELAGAAVGKGRQAYEAAGFTCQPSPAGGGDTSYACAGDDARVTFRYGAV